jgi:hypothetical protein
MGEHSTKGRAVANAGMGSVKARYVAPETAFKIYTPQEIGDREEARLAREREEALKREEALVAMKILIAERGAAAAGAGGAVSAPQPAEEGDAPLESITPEDAAAFADPVFGPYLRLIRMGMPMEQIIMKLRSDKVLGDMNADSETLESLLMERLPST